MISPDAQLSIWITGLAGRIPFVDHLMTLLASDFFVPVCLSLTLLGFWFGTQDPAQRRRNQWGVMGASFALGIANLIVWLLNHPLSFDPWPRPFEVHESARQAVGLVFYMPHDPSFPSNGAAAFFAAAVGMWLRNPKASIPLFTLAILWSFARVYAGVHYPLDILGGAAIGAFTGYVCFKILCWGELKIALIFKLARLLYLA